MKLIKKVFSCNNFVKLNGPSSRRAKNEIEETWDDDSSSLSTRASSKAKGDNISTRKTNKKKTTTRKKKTPVKRCRSMNDADQATKVVSADDTMTPNERLVAVYVEELNKQAPSEKLLSYYLSDTVKISFENSPSVPSRDLVDEMQKIYQSFPDVHFRYDSIKEDEEGHVVVDELQVTGTHTGEPYGFANFPAVPTTNKHCINDPERMVFTIREGKFVRMECIALGSVTGASGLYTTIQGNKALPPFRRTKTCP